MEDHAAIRLYCGIGEQQWNHYPVSPGAYACISPIYGTTTKNKQVNRVTVPPETMVLQDSGAFSDGPGHRLNVKDALKRQERHAERFGYASCIEARASYDLLIDEVWHEGERGGTLARTKRRWSETQAEFAVEETIHAAAFLSSHRNGLPCVLSAQGVSARQYQRCAEKILPYLHDGDLFGLGGWCITGKLPAQMLPVFKETMHLVIPFLGREGVKRVHLWGVCYAPALGELLWLCDQWGIVLSTDSMGPSVRPVKKRWGYANWRDTGYIVAPAKLPQCDEADKVYSLVKGHNGTLVRIEHSRGVHRAEHVRQVRAWLRQFRFTPYYPQVQPLWLTQPQQLLLAM